MFGLSQVRNKMLAGIDISSAAVKIIVLSKSGPDYQVEGYAVVPFADGVVVEGKINEVEVVGDAISKALIKARAGSVTGGAVCIPAQQVIRKEIQVPSGLSDAELESLVESEADQYVPFDVDDIQSDYVVLGQNERNPEFDDVLFAACRKEYVEDRVASLENAGLKPEVVDVESYAVARVVELINSRQGIYEDKIVAVIDVGASETSLTVLKDGVVIYGKNAPFGGRNLTDDIQKKYGMTFEDAGYAKKIGGLPDDFELDVLGPFKFKLLQEITQFLNWFVKSSEYDHVDEILLAGGSAAIRDLDLFIYEETRYPTAVLNPFASMKVRKGIDGTSLAEDAPALLLAAGLALRSFDS